MDPQLQEMVDRIVAATHQVVTRRVSDLEQQFLFSTTQMQQQIHEQAKPISNLSRDVDQLRSALETIVIATSEWC
jgi:hypothetical protein